MTAVVAQYGPVTSCYTCYCCGSGSSCYSCNCCGSGSSYISDCNSYCGYHPPTYSPVRPPTYSPVRPPTYSPVQVPVTVPSGYNQPAVTAAAAAQAAACAQKKVSSPGTTCCGIGITGSPGYCNPGYDCTSTFTCLQSVTNVGSPTTKPVQAVPSGSTPSNPSPSDPTCGPVCCEGTSFPAGTSCCGSESIIVYACPSGQFCSNSTNHTCASTAGLIIGIIAALLFCSGGGYRAYRSEKTDKAAAVVVATNDNSPTIEAPAAGGGSSAALHPTVVNVSPQLVDPAAAKAQAGKKAKKKKGSVPALTPTLTPTPTPIIQAIQPQSPVATTESGPRPSDVVVYDTHHGHGVQMSQMQAVAQPSAPAFQLQPSASAFQLQPSAPAFQLPPTLPPNWIVQTDPSSGAPFFVYTPTGHTQWNSPV